MKAMLYADWRSVRRSVKAILWVVLVMSVAASAFGGVMVVPFMLTMLSLMFPATLMNTDHAYGWDKLSLTLPVSRLLYPQLQKDYMKLLFAEREEL